MSTEREALEMQMKHLELKEAYIAAKAVDRDSDECKAAKAALNEHRRYWREIRDYLKATGAAPLPADGDAVAAPDTLAMTSTIQEG